MDALSGPDNTDRFGSTDNTALPAEAPVTMPQQSLWQRTCGTPRSLASPKLMPLRRGFILASTVALTAFAAHEMYLVLQVAGLTVLEAMILVLFVVLFAWIAFSFTSTVAGFAHLLLGRDRPLGINTRQLPLALAHRTALLLPIYNESPFHVTARLQAMYESLASVGALASFEFFLLSDTTDPDIWIAEEAAFLQLRDRTGGHDRIFYRHRYNNEGRKAGNIAEWVKRFGGNYDHMIVLDADSLMTAETMVQLAAAMEAHPQVGLIQTLPVIINGQSLFARLQQFAGRVYGPLNAHGMAWWHGTESNYWGHNAIIRTTAFAEQAGLPTLPGRKPIGGHIMSHDFVEAALLRRAGWAIHMVPGAEGSYEEGPPSIPDYSARDRRWAQGNLQHIGVLPARGLHWVSRLHLLTGIGSYITAPLWLVFLLAGLVIALQAQFIRPEYFPSDFSLFPQWPAQDPVRAAWVFVGTMGLLIAPKLLGYFVLLTDVRMRRGCGGAVRSFMSLVVESVLSALIAPMMMITQSATVLGALLGRDVGWQVQRRDDGTMPVKNVVQRYAWHTAFGVLLAAAACAISVPLFLWMTPVLAGLLLAIPLALLTADPSVGDVVRRLGLLLIPEEHDPPLLVLRSKELVEGGPAAGDDSAMGHLALNARLAELHRMMLVPQSRHRGHANVNLVVGLAKLDDARTFREGVEFLTKPELLAVLSDPLGFERLMALQEPGCSSDSVNR